MQYVIAPTSDYLAHSAKGSEWKNHKYVKKADGRYYYPNSYKGGRHLSDDKKSSNKEKNHASYSNTIEKISDLTGMKEESIDELITIAETKGFDSDEYKNKCQTLSEGDPDMYNRINRILMADVITDDKESLNDYTKRMAEKVINGEFGDGEERKEALGDNYERVQRKANEIAKKETDDNSNDDDGEYKLTEKDIDDLAKEALNGGLGDGEVRKELLGSWYDDVQKRVNELSSKKKLKHGIEIPAYVVRPSDKMIFW